MTEISRVAQIVLVRLVIAGERGQTFGEIRKLSLPLLAHRLQGSELDLALEQAVEELLHFGLVVRLRKGKTDRTTVTPIGKSFAHEELGFALQSKPDWNKAKKTWLAAQTLASDKTGDLDAQSLGKDETFQAVLARILLDLAIPSGCTLQSAIDAYVWTLLGFQPGPKFNVKNVQAAVLSRELGVSSGLDSKPNPKKEIIKILGKKLGVRQSGKDELRIASIRRWLDEDRKAANERPQHSVAPASSATTDIDLPAFARIVLEAARECPDGRFGDDRVFIGRVWNHVKSRPEFENASIDHFKQKLARASRERLLSLGCADLVDAMDPRDVEESEIVDMGGSWHFVRIGSM